LHRWDITGDDDTSQALLAQPFLVEHAVWVLNNMPILNESAHGLGARATSMYRITCRSRAGRRDRLAPVSLPRRWPIYRIMAGCPGAATGRIRCLFGVWTRCPHLIE